MEQIPEACPGTLPQPLIFVCSPELPWKSKILPTFISIITCWGEEGECPPGRGGQQTEPGGIATRAKHQPVLTDAAGDLRVSVAPGPSLELWFLLQAWFLFQGTANYCHTIPSIKLVTLSLQLQFHSQVSSLPDTELHSWKVKNFGLQNLKVQNFTPGWSKTLVYKT